MTSRYIDIPQKSAIHLRVLRITILVLAFIGTPLFSIQGLIYFGFCTLIVMGSFIYPSDSSSIRKFDGLQKWIGFFLVIALLVLTFQDWDYHPLRMPAILSTSLLVITAISVLGVNSDDFFYSLLISYILVIYVLNPVPIFESINSLYQYLSTFITTGKIYERNLMPMPTSIGFAGMVGFFYFFITRKKIRAIMILILFAGTFMKSMWLAGFITLLLWLARNQLGLVKRAWPRYLIISIIVVGIIISNVIIGLYYYDKLEIIYLTSYRAIFYHSIVNDILQRGISVLLPIGNLYSETVVSSATDLPIISKNMYLSVLGTQCAHCTFFEWISDYGVIGIFLIFWLIKFVNEKNIWFISIYLLTIAFICDALQPAFFIPFYVTFKLSNNWQLAFAHKKKKVLV